VSIWLVILAGLILAIVSIVGVVLTLFTLPGVWLILMVAAACQFVFPVPPFSWWTIGICAGLAMTGEVFELVASAAGAKVSGGGRSGAIGSVIGAMVGAVAGTFIPIPIAGTVMGAVVGAGVGALIAERGVAGKTWRQSAAIGTGAAGGRLVATVAKVAITAAVGVVLTVAAVV
jgi:uncharacterized protein